MDEKDTERELDVYLSKTRLLEYRYALPPLHAYSYEIHFISTKTLKPSLFAIETSSDTSTLITGY